jgi:hypothetical protein
MFERIGCAVEGKSMAPIAFAGLREIRPQEVGGEGGQHAICLKNLDLDWFLAAHAAHPAGNFLPRDEIDESLPLAHVQTNSLSTLECSISDPIQPVLW